MPRRARRQVLRSVAVTGVAATAGCVGLLGDGGGSDSSVETFPPGTDETGVADAEALFEAHREVLSDTSYTYRRTLGDGSTSSVQEVTGRQQRGSDGPRFVRKRETFVVDDDARYRAEARTVTDHWHGAGTATDLEYRRELTDVLVADEDAYSASPRAEDFPPGQRVSYDRRRQNTLLSQQRNVPLGLVLRPLTFDVRGSRELSGRTHVEFEVATLRPEARSQPVFEDVEEISVGGGLLVRADGLLRRATAAVEVPWSLESGHHSMAISDVGATTVREEPAWVDREFSGDP